MGDYYISYSMGDDDNVGSEAFPWKHHPGMTAAEGNADSHVYSSGDTFSLKRGDTWELWEDSPTQTANGEFRVANNDATAALPIVHKAYGTGADPILNGLMDVNNNSDSETWEESPSNVWTITVKTTTSTADRLFIDGVGQKLATSVANVEGNGGTDDGTWFHDQAGTPSTVTLYSTTDPSLNEVRINPSDGSVNTAWTTVNLSYHTFQDIEIHGSLEECMRAGKLTAAARYGGVYDGLTLRYAGGQLKNGITLGSSAGGVANPIYDTTVKNCLINKDMSAIEGESWGTQDAGGNGIIIPEAQFGAIIESNVIVDFTHAGIDVQTTANGDPDEMVKNIIVRHNEVYLINSGYCRGLDVTGTATEVENVHFYGNYVHDCNVQSQFMGKNITVTGNVFADIGQNGVDPEKPGRGMSSAIGSGNDIDNIILANNVCIRCDGVGIRVSDRSLYPIANDSIQVCNNIVHECGTVADGQSTDTIGLALLYDMSLSGSSGTQIVKNNYLYSSATSNIVEYDGTAGTVAQFESYISDATRVTGNVEQEVPLNADFTMQDATLFESGVFTTFSARDYRGRPFHIPPTIGAYEYTSGCPTATTRGNATSRSNASSRSAVSGTRTTRTGC